MAKKKNDAKPKRVKLSIPADLAAAVEASGADLEGTVERLLREALAEPTGDRLGSAKQRIAGFFQEIAGPYVPQLEAVAKEVASKVAKDVATAAAAAALAAFTAKAAANGDDKPKDGESKPAPKRRPKNDGDAQ